MSDMDGLKTRKKFFTPKVYIVAASVLIVFLAAAAGFFFWKYLGVKDGGNVTAEQEKSESVINKVGKLYQLPTGEEPTVAQVQDKKKLDKQEFFALAEDGDYILIYKEARVAMIYRESINKLINVGPITLDNQEGGEAAGASTELTPKQP
jgi:hypothetical protein